MINSNSDKQNRYPPPSVDLPPKIMNGTTSVDRGGGTETPVLNGGEDVSVSSGSGGTQLLERDYYGCYCLKFIVKNGTHTTEDKVLEDFGAFGEVVDVRGPGLFSGLRGNHVYVRFIDRSDAEEALRSLSSKYHQLTPASISDVLPDNYGLYTISFYNKTGIPSAEVRREFSKFGEVKNLTGSLDVKGGRVFVSYKEKGSAVAALQAFFFRKDRYPNMKFALPRCEKDYFGCYCLKFYNKSGDVTEDKVMRDFGQFGDVVDVRGPGLFDVTGDDVYVRYKEKSSAEQALIELVGKYDSLCLAPPSDIQADKFGYFTITFVNDKCLSKSDVWYIFSKFGTVACVNGTFDCKKGRVFVSYKEKQGALNALETMLITKEYHLQVSKNSTVRKNDYNVAVPPPGIVASSSKDENETFENIPTSSSSTSNSSTNLVTTTTSNNNNGSGAGVKRPQQLPTFETAAANGAVAPSSQTPSMAAVAAVAAAAAAKTTSPIVPPMPTAAAAVASAMNGRMPPGVPSTVDDLHLLQRVQQQQRQHNQQHLQQHARSRSREIIPPAAAAAAPQQLLKQLVTSASTGITNSSPSFQHPPPNMHHENSPPPLARQSLAVMAAASSNIPKQVMMNNGGPDPIMMNNMPASNRSSNGGLVKFNRNVEKDIFGYYCLSFLNEDGDINEKKVRHDFGKFGEVVSVRGALGKQKGHVFVRFRRKEAAENCLNCLNSFPLSEMSELFGKYLFLSPATPRDIDCDTYRHYSISFLNLNMKPFREIRQEFSKFGEIVRMTPGGGGNTEELVTISFNDKNAAIKALQTHFTNKEFPYLDIAKGSSLLLVNSSDSSDNEDYDFESNRPSRQPAPIGPPPPALNAAPGAPVHHTSRRTEHSPSGNRSEDPFHDPIVGSNGQNDHIGNVLGSGSSSDVVDELLKPFQSYFSIYRTGQYHGVDPIGSGSPMPTANNASPNENNYGLGGALGPNGHHQQRSPEKKYRIKSVKMTGNNGLVSPPNSPAIKQQLIQTNAAEKPVIIKNGQQPQPTAVKPAHVLNGGLEIDAIMSEPPKQQPKFEKEGTPSSVTSNSSSKMSTTSSSLTATTDEDDVVKEDEAAAAAAAPREPVVVEKDMFGLYSVCFVSKSKDVSERKVRMDFEKHDVDVARVRGQFGPGESVTVSFNDKEVAEKCCTNQSLLSKYPTLCPAPAVEVVPDKDGHFSIEFSNSGMSGIREITQEFSKHGEVVKVMASGAKSNAVKRVTVSYADKQSAFDAVNDAHDGGRKNKDFLNVDFAKECLLELKA